MTILSTSRTKELGLIGQRVVGGASMSASNARSCVTRRVYNIELSYIKRSHSKIRPRLALLLSLYLIKYMHPQSDLRACTAGIWGWHSFRRCDRWMEACDWPNWELFPPRWQSRHASILSAFEILKSRDPFASCRQILFSDRMGIKGRKHLRLPVLPPLPYFTVFSL